MAQQDQNSTVTWEDEQQQQQQQQPAAAAAKPGDIKLDQPVGYTIPVTDPGTALWEDEKPEPVPKSAQQPGAFQTHPGGPILNSLAPLKTPLDALRTPGGNLQDVAALQDLPLWQAYHTTLTQNLADRESPLWKEALPQVTGLFAGLAAGGWGIGPETDEAVAYTTKYLIRMAARQAMWDSLVAGGVAGGTETGRHALARYVAPGQEPPRDWFQAISEPGKDFLTTGILSYPFTFAGRTGDAMMFKRVLPKVQQATELLYSDVLKSNDPDLRQSMIMSVDDLARMAKQDQGLMTDTGRYDPNFLAHEKGQPRGVFAPGAGGGLTEPDMRTRAQVESMDRYLDQKYDAQVRQPMDIANRLGVTVNLSGMHPGDMEMALNGVASDLAPSSPVHAIIERIRQNPSQISIQDANDLRMQVNRSLLAYESKNPQAQLTARMTQPQVDTMKSLDLALKSATTTSMNRVGLPGFDEYERQYAALNEIRNEISRSINGDERERLRLSVIPVVRAGGVGVKAAPYNFGATRGKSLQKAMTILADDPSLGTQPLWHANVGGPGPYGLLAGGTHTYGPPGGGPHTVAAPIQVGAVDVPAGMPNAPSPVTVGQSRTERQGRLLPPAPIAPQTGAPRPFSASGSIPVGTPEVPPGPPAVGTHLPPPGTRLAPYDYGAGASQVLPTGGGGRPTLFPLPGEPTVPAKNIPPVAEPPQRLTSPFGQRRYTTGPAPQPASQQSLLALSHEYGPISKPAEAPNVPGTTLPAATAPVGPPHVHEAMNALPFQMRYVGATENGGITTMEITDPNITQMNNGKPIKIVMKTSEINADSLEAAIERRIGGNK